VKNLNNETKAKPFQSWFDDYSRWQVVNVGVKYPLVYSQGVKNITKVLRDEIIKAISNGALPQGKVRVRNGKSGCSVDFVVEAGEGVEKLLNKKNIDLYNIIKSELELIVGQYDRSSFNRDALDRYASNYSRFSVSVYIRKTAVYNDQTEQLTHWINQRGHKKQKLKRLYEGIVQVIPSDAKKVIHEYLKTDTETMLEKLAELGYVSISFQPKHASTEFGERNWEREFDRRIKIFEKKFNVVVDKLTEASTGMVYLDIKPKRYFFSEGDYFSCRMELEKLTDGLNLSIKRRDGTVFNWLPCSFSVSIRNDQKILMKFRPKPTEKTLTKLKLGDYVVVGEARHPQSGFFSLGDYGEVVKKTSKHVYVAVNKGSLDRVYKFHADGPQAGMPFIEPVGLERGNEKLGHVDTVCIVEVLNKKDNDRLRRLAKSGDSADPLPSIFGGPKTFKVGESRIITDHVYGSHSAYCKIISFEKDYVKIRLEGRTVTIPSESITLGKRRFRSSVFAGPRQIVSIGQC
jgi:hypothetical protein